jgi:hypothetical protein
MVLNPQHTYVHLAFEGTATKLPGADVRPPLCTVDANTLCIYT